MARLSRIIFIYIPLAQVASLLFGWFVFEPLFSGLFNTESRHIAMLVWAALGLFPILAWLWLGGLGRDSRGGQRGCSGLCAFGGGCRGAGGYAPECDLERFS